MSDMVERIIVTREVVGGIVAAIIMILCIWGEWSKDKE